MAETDLILLPPAYLGSVEYYAALAAFPKAVIDWEMKFDKRQKSAHRCDIADTHGLRQLTVPVEKPVSMTGARWNDIVISAHGAWWHVHLETLKSAYGRTPFFEYYLDDLERFYSADRAGERLCDYCKGLDALLRRLMGVETAVSYSLTPDETGLDCRRGIPEGLVKTMPYYQVRSLSQGFIPGLSAVDLLFNLGPESIFLLESMSTLKLREELGPCHNFHSGEGK